MIRFVLIFVLVSGLAACGLPRGPAPVVYHGDEALSPPQGLASDETIPDAAPIKPVESQALEPLEPSTPDVNAAPSTKAARVPLKAPVTTTGHAASGVGSTRKGAMKVAKTGGKAGRKALSRGKPNHQPQRQTSGQVNVVPAKIRPASIKVARGDTLFAISEKYQIALKPLIAQNNLKPPYALKAGQTLKLPPPLHYRVRAGDTVMAISRRFSLDFRSLALINNIEPPYVLRADELLILPSLVRGKDGQWKSAIASRKASMTRSGTRKPASVGAKRQPSIQAPSRNSTFAWPVNGPVISGFGVKPGGMRNDGINISASAGTAVRAAGSGTVVYAGAELKSFGNLILIRHPNGWVSAYAHNRTLLVKEGAKVLTGDTIAEVGSTGSVSAPQLHFETRRGRNPVNPILHLPQKG